MPCVVELDVNEHRLSTTRLDIGEDREEGGSLVAVGCFYRFRIGDDIIREWDSFLLLSVFEFGRALW